MSLVEKSTQFYSGFTPRQYPGCQLWLDASDRRTITRNATSNVTTWADKSGNGYDMTYHSTLSNATVSSAFQNNLDVLNFSGSNVYKAPAGSACYPLDCYVVMALKSPLTRCDVITENTNTTTDNFNSLTFSEYTSLRWHNGSTTFSRTPNTVSTSNETSSSFLIMNWSIANNNFLLRRNGVLLRQTASYTFTLSANSIFQLGYRQSTALVATPDVALSAYIAEIVVYNSQLAVGDRVQVEGYLARKWGLQTSLPSGHPYRSVPPFTRPLSPLDITGCQVWLDAADRGTFTLSGSSVTQWNDKSGNARHAVGNLGTGSYSSNGFNSRPTVQITSSGNMRAAIPAQTFATGLYLFVMFQKTGASAGVDTVVNRASPTTAQPAPFDWYTNNTQEGTERTARLVGNGTNSANVGDTTTKLARRTTPTVLFHGIVGVASGSTIFLDESVDGTLTTFNMGSTFTYGDTASNIHIGTRADNFTKMIGNISEIIAYTGSSFSAAQRQQMEGYLAWKWGLQGNLPATHPFKLYYPMVAVFNPLQIANCAIWFDGADTSTITGTTQITSWVNKGSLGSTAGVGAGSCTSGNLVNGLNYVSCPAGTELRFTLALNTQPRTWFFVSRKSTPLGSGQTSTLIGNMVSGGQNSVVLAFVNATTYVIRSVAEGVNTRVAANVVSAPLSNVYMTSIVNSATVGLNVLTVNGTSQTLTVTSAATGYNVSSVTYRISAGGNNQSVDIMEILFYYGDLTPADRQRVEGYLAWKWGIQASLPSAHAYKNIRP